MEKYEIKLHELGLYRAIRVTLHGINDNPVQFFALQEMHTPCFVLSHTQRQTWHSIPSDVASIRITDGALSL